jgi:hypothetical protein
MLLQRSCWIIMIMMNGLQKRIKTKQEKNQRGQIPAGTDFGILKHSLF